MPRGAYGVIEKLAVDIVSQEEIDRGWKPGPILGQRAQHDEGCDLLSEPPNGAPPQPIEIKGWGEPLLNAAGGFTYPADVNAEQLERARNDPNWRLEIVGNLHAVRDGTGPPQRITLDAAEVVERAVGWRFRIPLSGWRTRSSSNDPAVHDPPRHACTRLGAHLRRG